MGYAEGITEMGDLVDSFVAQTRTSTRTDSQVGHICSYMCTFWLTLRRRVSFVKFAILSTDRFFLKFDICM